MGLSPLIRKLTAVVTYQRRCFPWPGMSLPGPWDEKKKVMKCLPNMVKFITMGFNSDELLSHVRLCNSMDCSMPGLPVHHQLQKFTQTHVHWVGDAIQPSHLLSSPSPPAFNLSQHQGLFKWVTSSHQMAKISEFQLQHQSFQWIFRTDFLLNGLVGFPCNPRDSQESFPTPQFKSINSSVLSFLYSPTLTSMPDYWKNHSSH